MYGYSRIQWETAGYSGSAAIWLDIDRYRVTVVIQWDTKQRPTDTVRYRREGRLQ